MFYRFTAIASLLLTLAWPAWGGVRHIAKDFAVGPGCSLNLDAYRGSIEILESEDSVIKVDVRLEAPGDDEKDVARRLDQIVATMTQQASMVTVSVTNPSRPRNYFDWHEDGRLDDAITVKVPRNCSVSVATTDGGITIGNISGTIKARARIGTIFLKHIDGSINAQTHTGDVIVSRCTGAVDLSTQLGNVQVGEIHGKATIKSASGDVEIQQADGGAEIYAEAGEIIAGFPKGFSEDAVLRTNGGSITAKFDLSARCSIDASSVWGSVKSALPLIVQSGGNNKSKMTATLNGGGPKIVLHADGGHVRLVAGDFLSAE